MVGWYCSDTQGINLASLGPHWSQRWDNLYLGRKIHHFSTQPVIGILLLLQEKGWMLLRMGFLCKLQSRAISADLCPCISSRARAEHWFTSSFLPHRGPCSLEAVGQQGETYSDALCSSFWMGRKRNPYLLSHICSDLVNPLSENTLCRLSRQKPHVAVELKGTLKLMPPLPNWNFPLSRTVSNYLANNLW